MKLQNRTVLCTLLLLHATVLPLLPCCEASRARRLTHAFRNEVTKEMSKFVVSIRSKRPHRVFGDNHFCNGAIVAPKFVLTVAKCTMSDKKVMHLEYAVVVVAGTFDRLTRGYRSLTLPVKNFYVPQEYFKSAIHNIALLEVLINWPTLNPSIQIINLPTEAPKQNMEFIVLGWGRLYRGGNLPAELNHINVTLLDHEKCLLMVRHKTPDMLCASDKLSEASPCAGDAGAPMVFNDTIYGLAAYFTACGHVGMTSIYTDVWFHIDWIHKTLEGGAHGLSRPVYVLLFYASTYMFFYLLL